MTLWNSVFQPVLNNFCLVDRGQSCWNIHWPSLKIHWAIAFNQHSRIDSCLYIRSIDFYSKFDKKLLRLDMAQQTIKDSRFWNHCAVLTWYGISSMMATYALSFWAFKYSSMVNSISSKNAIRFTLPPAYRRSNALDLSNLLWRCCLVKPWTLRRLNGVSPRSSLRIV